MITRRTILGATPAALAAPASAVVPDDNVVIAECLGLLDQQADLRTGGDGDAAVSAHVRATLRAAGFRVNEQRVTAPRFSVRRSQLAWEGGDVTVTPQAPVRPTGPAGVQGPLRLWRDSSDTPRMGGAIAVVMLPYARHSQLMSEPIRSILVDVVSAGPVGIVLVTDGPSGETILLNAPALTTNVPAIPLVVLGPKPGARAIAQARVGGEATLTLEGETHVARSANIWGTINRDAPLVVVSTPRTAWTPAVGERGGGFAAFTALASWAPSALPRHSLLFVSTTAHEFDNAGASAFFDRHAPDPTQVALWVHLGAGFAARDFHEITRFVLAPLPSPDAQRFLTGSESLIPTLRQAFAGQAGLEAAYPTSAGSAMGELGEVLRRGYAPAFGLFGAHRFHHTMQDRLDKADPAIVRSVIDSTKTAILRACSGQQP